MNLSNALTLSRLAAIPVLMVLLMARFPGHDQVAAALFILFSLTDTLDGLLARRQGTVSDLGRFLDPLADKLFVLSVLIVLVQEGLVAAWVVVLIFSRELIITILRSVGTSQGRVIGAAPLGKTKTVMQMSAVTLLILQRPYPWLVGIADVAVGVAIIFTIWSGLDYLWRFRYLLGPFDSSQIAGRTGPSGGAPEAGEPTSSEAEAGRELGEALRKAGLTIAVAESCTGGLVGSLISAQPGSSAYFLGGVIAYSDEVKRAQLGVPAALLESKGAVSTEVAEAMAEGARLRFGARVAISITGIAGPDGGSPAKPVGLTYIGVASAGGTSAREYRFKGDRWANRREAAAHAIRLAIEEARALERARANSA
ncbi:MAG TPA: CDP-diacylglycerol--glycerol-3-phosphate 3-phosphatidyltransferase [Candidatus Dormibacteraeota bacterium]|nr:CDP-diacylglycerol--glycerol-3-phosphate 3-phosphatidyltransferase [Candidatus Dormibacteraeota bacterium]